MKAAWPDEEIVIYTQGAVFFVFGRYRGLSADGFPHIEVLESTVICGQMCMAHSNLYALPDSLLLGDQSGVLHGSPTHPFVQGLARRSARNN